MRETLRSMDLKGCDIILSTTDEAASRVIRIGTWGDVSHSILYVGGGFCIESIPPVARQVQLSVALAASHTALVLRIPHLTQEQMGKILQSAISSVGTPYGLCRAMSACNYIPNGMDLGGIFCSELVSKAYAAAGINLANRAPRDTTPADINKSNNNRLLIMGYFKKPE